MKKKIFIFSNYKKIKDDLILNKEINDIFFFSIKFKENLFKKISKKNFLILILKNEKNTSLENKISILVEFLEIINKLKIKNKIFITSESENLKNKNLANLEYKIFLEIINSYTNMFKLNLNFSNYNSIKKIKLNELCKLN